MIRELPVTCACPACAPPAPESARCVECDQALALARAAHPTSTSLPEPPGDDLDTWDAWALLGDPGERGAPFRR